jgi:CO dehydrogenase maturation factor
MTFTIAVAGKGGVGKSTLSALLVRFLAERSGKVVLAVDADPNANLGEKLGVNVEKTIGDLREDLLKRADEIPSSTSKQEFVRYQIQLAMVEGTSFDLLTMGRPEGPGCYCYINNILRMFLDTVMADYPYVVIDNEAGMEHLSRRTTRMVNLLVVVSDSTKLGIETATKLLNLAREMKIEMGRTMLIMNRVQGEIHPVVKRLIEKSGFDDVVNVPFDAKVEALSFSGEPLTKLDPSSAMYRTLLDVAKSLDN